MGQSYYTFRIHITNRNNVRVEEYDPDNNSLGEPSGNFAYKGETQTRIKELQQLAYEGELKGPNVKVLGETLFDALFDEGLRRDFFRLYEEKVRREGALLRLELDVDERQLPDVAALPWEFMRVPSNAGYGEVWLGTAPDLIFSRRRARWVAPEPIQLRTDERLRIALAVAVPSEGELGPVRHKKIWEGLEKLATEQADRIELLELVNPATPVSIDGILEQKPHIFHFIGHGRLKDENQRESGQIALVDDMLNQPMWIGAERFSELFNRHQPGIVVLQACEGAALSASEAFVGVASRVIEQNIAVIVAMQYEVSNSTARRFVLEFYRRLSENDPVDKATQEGRRSISLGPAGYTARDFATPVLFMRVRAGYLFQRPTAAVQPESIQMHVVASKKGLIALIDLMRLPQVRDSVVAFQANFQAAREQIDVLDNHKRLHDLLHTVQFQCHNLIVQEAKRASGDKTDWDTLARCESDFQFTVDDLQKVASGASSAMGETSWIQDLVEAWENLHGAVEDSDMERLKKAAWLTKRVLSIQPSLINTRLSSAARTLRLPDLVEAMTSVRNVLTRLDLDPKEVRQFEAGVHALDTLNHSLNTLINEHDKWQATDIELRRIEDNLKQDMSELKSSWPGLRAMTEPLYGSSADAWAQSLKEDSEKLENAIGEDDLAKVKQYFLRYRTRANNRFYRVDLNLKDLCDDLRKVGEPLASVLEMIGR